MSILLQTPLFAIVNPTDGSLILSHISAGHGVTKNASMGDMLAAGQEFSEEIIERIRRRVGEDASQSSGYVGA